MKLECEETLKIADGIYYTRIADWVYLRDVNRKCDCRFNLVSGDILDQFRVWTTVGRAIERLRELYNVSDEQEFQESIIGFVCSLLQKNVLERRCPERTVDDMPARIQTICAEEHRLWSACLELTYRCNEKCRHCYLDDPSEIHAGGELTLDEYREIVAELQKLGTMSVLVTGGEPTLRSDVFVPICKEITKRGMLLNVYTNALALSDSVMDELSAMRVNSVSCSLYGLETFHDSITAVHGSFVRSWKNLLTMKAMGIDVYVKTVLFGGHLDDYRALVAACSRINIKVVASPFLIKGHGGRDNSSLAVSADELRAFYLEGGIVDYEGGAFDSPRRADDYICAAGHTTISVNPYGDVYPCNAYPYAVGNVRTDNLEDIWYHSAQLAKLRALRLKNVSSECEHCRYSQGCMTCIGSMLRENEGQLRPCSVTCRNARIYAETVQTVLRRS